MRASGSDCSEPHYAAFDRRQSLPELDRLESLESRAPNPAEGRETAKIRSMCGSEFNAFILLFGFENMEPYLCK